MTNDIYVYSEPIHNAHFYYVHAMYYIQLVGFYIQPAYINIIVTSKMLLHLGKTGKSFMAARRKGNA
jgi:hypothetical protein